MRVACVARRRGKNEGKRGGAEGKGGGGDWGGEKGGSACNDPIVYALSASRQMSMVLVKNYPIWQTSICCQIIQMALSVEIQ